jgi:hypothetical protein
VTDTTLDPEDAKLITLARSQRARNGAPQGAAVRDETGRTYAAATVSLPSLSLSALQLAVAMAVSGGAARLEAAALVGTTAELSNADRSVCADLGGPTLPILLAAPDGSLHATLLAG